MATSCISRASLAALGGARREVTARTNRRHKAPSSRGRVTPRVTPRAVAVRASEDEELDRAGDARPNQKWTRVMLKVSGEALAGEGGFGINADVVNKIARQIAESALAGVQVAVVVGGGNFFRGAAHEGKGLDRASADYMGMLATVMNAISLQAAVEANGVATRVMTAFSMPEVAEPYVRRRAIRHLEKGRVVIFGAGTGNPFFTTDTGAALRAAEIQAQVVLKATMVDGVYDCDPKRNDDAQLYESLTYETVQRLGLGVMDLTAITLCQENDIPVVVFNMDVEGNIVKALRGNKIGTCVSSDVHKFERLDDEQEGTLEREQRERGERSV